MKNRSFFLFRHFQPLTVVCAVALACTAMLPGRVAAQTPVDTADAVGEVTLHIGQAVRVSASGDTQAVQRGTSIRAGDRIETAEGGHVHIRFVDGALVSVRPTSRLVVENYQYNPQQVAQSLVRFRLEKGITRAISGAAAEGAKDRFRLNTPLVAIGVRGTDFVVSSQAGQTVASVNQGAIVMAPFGEGCLAQSFGPCGSVTAKLLSADMGHMLVEFKPTLSQPELRMLENLKPSDANLAQASTPAGSSDAAGIRQTNSKPQVRGPGDDAVMVASVQNVNRIADIAVSAEPLRPPVLVKPPSPVGPPVVVAPPPAIGTPAPSQLAWGRWSAAALGAEDFSQLRTEARTNRAVTVGDDNFVLYRAENASGSLAQNLGTVGFALQQSYAQFAAPTGTLSPATVVNGSLTVDFANRNFSTLLNLNSLPTGAVAMQSSGFVRDDGIFFNRSSNQNIAGALAFDGKSAGYFFDKAAAGGVLSGITLWSR